MHGEDGRVAHRPALLAQRLGDQLRGQRRRVARETFAYVVQQLGRHRLGHAASRPVAAAATSDTERAARASVPRRDRAGPAPRLIASSRPRWSPIAASQGHPQQPAHRLGRDPRAAAAGDEVPRRRRLREAVGHPCRRSDTGHRQRRDQYDVVTAADRLVDDGVPVPGQVDHHGVEPAPPGREHLAHRERLQRRRPIGGPGQHRELARRAATPRAATASSACRWSAASSPSGCRRSPPARARGRHRRRSGRRRPAASARHPRPSAPWRRRRRSLPLLPEPPITPIVTPGAAPPSPTSVSSSTSQVSEAGRPATVSAPTPSASRNMVSPTGERPRTCTRWRRGGLAAASTVATVRPDEHDRGAGPQPDGVGGVAHDLRHHTGGGAQAMDVGDEQRVGRDEERGSHIHAPIVRPLREPGRSAPRTLWTPTVGLAAVDAKWPSSRENRPFCLHFRHEPGGPTDGSVLRPRQDDHREVEHARVQPRVPGRRSDLPRCGAAVGVRTVRLPRRRRRPRPDGEDAAVHVAAVCGLGRRDGQGDRRRHPAQHRRPPCVRRGGEPDRGAPPRRPRRHHRLDQRVGGRRADRRDARRRQGDRDPDGRRRTASTPARSASTPTPRTRRRRSATSPASAATTSTGATPTATRSPTCTCSRRSATPTRSTPTRICAGSRATAAGRSWSSTSRSPCAAG